MTARPQLHNRHEWLPVRALCPDGRLRMVEVRHERNGTAYALAPDSCGRIPAFSARYQGAYTPGWYANGRFFPRTED